MGGVDLGRALGPLEHPHAGLPRQPARLAHRRAPPRLRPELNPVEYLWANLKDLELANLPTTTLEEVADATTQGIKRVCKRDDLVTGFLAPTGLALDDEPSTQPTKLNKDRALIVTEVAPRSIMWGRTHRLRRPSREQQ